MFTRIRNRARSLAVLLTDLLGYAVYRPMQNLVRKHALGGVQEFYGTAQFPWVADLEAAWPAVRRELDSVLERLADLPDYKSLSPSVYPLTATPERWRLFQLYLFGWRMDRNCGLCPETERALRRIPGMKTGQFSILKPGAHLIPHKGPYAGVLRCHLALKVPPDRESCWIRVGGSRRTWEEGKVLIFDESQEHEAMNASDETRVVLFIDFKRPLPWWADLLNEGMLRLIARTSHIRGSLRGGEEWEKAFYRKVVRPTEKAPAPAEAETEAVGVGGK